MRSRSARSYSGFSIVELLHVVFIMAVLAAILFPVFEGARKTAWRSVCISNIRQLTQAQLLYVEDYDDCLPSWIQYEPGEFMPGYKYWTEIIRSYVRSEDIFWDHAARELKLPPREGKLLSHYALYTWGSDRLYGSGTQLDPYWQWPGAPLTLAQVPRKSETFNLMDGYTATFQVKGYVYRHHLDGYNGMNGGFLDCHVGWITRERADQLLQDSNGKYHLKFASATFDY
jgi:type II secretory pathway pseudopilin PulG